MADEKPTIPGPKPGEAAPAAKPAPVIAPAPAPVVKSIEPSQDRVDAHTAAGFPPAIAKVLASVEESAPPSERVDRPEPDAASAQAVRSVDPAEPHGFVDEDFKRAAAGAHPVDLSSAEIVASAEAAHTFAKGLTQDGTAANGLTLGDRIPG